MYRIRTESLESDISSERLQEQALGEKLLKAVKDENMEKVIEELEKGANPGAVDPTPIASSALHWAAKQGNVAIAKILVLRGADVNKRDKTGQAPIHRAAYWGRVEMVHFLAFVGADLSPLDNSSLSPSDVARKRGNSMISTLLDQATSTSSQRRRGSLVDLFRVQGKEDKLLGRREKLEQKLKRVEGKLQKYEGGPTNMKTLEEFERLTSKEVRVKSEIQQASIEFAILRASSFNAPSSEGPTVF